MKLLNLKTDLPYLARKSKDVNEFLEHWNITREKLNILKNNTFYKFKYLCSNIIDEMDKTNKIEFYEFHTN